MYCKPVVKHKMSKRILWSVEVPRHLNEQLNNYIEIDAFKTKSEFIRTAVRDRLREEINHFRLQEDIKQEKIKDEEKSC